MSYRSRQRKRDTSSVESSAGKLHFTTRQFNEVHITFDDEVGDRVIAIGNVDRDTLEEAIKKLKKKK